MSGPSSHRRLEGAPLRAPDGVPAARVPAQTPTPGIQGAPNERRNGARRQPAPDRAFAPLDEPEPVETPSAGYGWAMIVVMGASVATAILFTLSWPGAMGSAALLAALGLVALSARLHGILGLSDNIRSKELLGRSASFALPVVPLFLFGLGMGGFVAIAGLVWEIAVCALATTGALAAVYLRRQPALLMAGQWLLWFGFCLSHLTPQVLAGLAAGLAVVAFAGREQVAMQEREDRRRAAQERAQNRARDILSDYEEGGQGWFWETDRRAQITYVSDAVARILGTKAGDLIGRPLVALFNLANSNEASERTLMFHLSTRSAFKELAVRAAVDGDERWWSISGRPIYDSFNNFIGFRGAGTDLTERKRSQEEVSRLANFDSLTGLANRFRISLVLEKFLTSPHEAGRACAIFLLDLDRFKHVNDTMGHPAGDALLKQVAQRLERTIGKMGQVGRLGGDEFKVVIPGRHETQMLADLAREVINSLSQPYAIEGQRVIIGASIGVAIAPQDGEKADDLVRNADLALYAAKDGGRGRYHFYSNDLHAEAEARAQLEEDLRDAITKGDMELFYQPVVSMENEQITGFEALLRWQHPVKGWIPPDRFIGTAEDAGLITQLGEWALRTACMDLACMPPEVRVAVNVSPLQFSSPQLPAVVTQAIARAGIRPDQLELEITESVFLSDDEGTEAMFKALKRIGVRLALDDFGTGYSSLGYLKKAPFDKIKIDQSFVHGATQPGSRNGAIIASITSLAKALGMETTAEGVETMDELELVRRHGCSHVQGYIYERPLTKEATLARLKQGLQAEAKGPRSARAPRQTMLRKVVLEHGKNRYDGTIRNISTTGAMIEGVWHVPVGTIFRLQISQTFFVSCTVRWAKDDRIGVEFANPLQRDGSGQLLAMQGAAPARQAGIPNASPPGSAALPPEPDYPLRYPAQAGRRG
ncbi:EAL domain-containing protein [Alteraurantiacibacter palmitatis]|uniref:EAL domain-containing protein n=1 Tax=Alteraurantiacibacter palmitatis TaxID=2054628 RepID=A0ABV7E7J4_9SPHN